MYKQQTQTKLFFNKNAKNWQIKSDVNKNKFLNTIQERNFYVVNQFKKLKINSLIDVGCGTGDLSYEASKIIKKSVGIDFSKNMIKLAYNKFKRKNLEFYYKNFFDIDINERFDCLSANGFIEYLSLKDIDKFIKISKKIVKQNKFIIFGTRNRLFNLFSLNKFTEKEFKKNTFKKFYEESIALNRIKFSDFIKLKKNKFEEVLFKQPKTGIDVDKRHQFSPLQLVDILKRNNWEPLDFYPINYHPVVPTKYSSKESKFFSNYIYLSKDSNKLPFIPFSSSFMVLAKNK
jgi:ubiquinone/menaquinone biosynthesis C-methylase UbiE